MPKLGPIERADLVRYLRLAGFEGPYSGGKHEFMVRKALRLRIPNPHHGSISTDLLVRVLRQAGIGREVWERL